jgi:hypothetical protein
MPHLKAYLESQRHQHSWRQAVASDGTQLEHCPCGAVRRPPEPEDD